jgi:hypothetical protein
MHQCIIKYTFFMHIYYENLLCVYIFYANLLCAYIFYAKLLCVYIFYENLLCVYIFYANLLCAYIFYAKLLCVYIFYENLLCVYIFYANLLCPPRISCSSTSSHPYVKSSQSCTAQDHFCTLFAVLKTPQYTLDHRRTFQCTLETCPQFGLSLLDSLHLV